MIAKVGGVIELMKYRILFSLVLSILIFISGCTNKESDINSKVKSDEVVFYGKGEEWLATYSIFKVKNSLFDSIYIQNIGGNRETKIGPIEYPIYGNIVVYKGSEGEQMGTKNNRYFLLQFLSVFNLKNSPLNIV